MTTGRGDRPSDAAGGPARHIPVLAREVVEALAPKPGGRYLDGTFGAGGYCRALFEACPHITILAIDRDPDAVAGGYALVDAMGGRLTVVEDRFSALDRVADDHGLVPLDGVMLDIGVSSMQLDDAHRGFSFRADAPLDMRMEQTGTSAADLLATLPEGELADLIYRYGEERRSRALARAIVAARKSAPVDTTGRLAEIVTSVVRFSPDGIHPATRTFQALRIAVNDELGELERGLAAAERVLAPGGRLAVVTFHSLEDRIVKRFLAERSGRAARPSRHAPLAETEVAPTFALIGRQPLAPSETEIARNPRARSAKLRVAERTDAPVAGSGGGRA
jgi:16S rRNA (cytosine1402-N4)-methyltransferase